MDRTALEAASGARRSLLTRAREGRRRPTRLTADVTLDHDEARDLMVGGLATLSALLEALAKRIEFTDIGCFARRLYLLFYDGEWIPRRRYSQAG